MLCIQAPGSFIIIYFLVFVSKESISTWLSYASAATQQVVLLVLLVYYDRQAKKAAIGIHHFIVQCNLRGE